MTDGNDTHTHCLLETVPPVSVAEGCMHMYAEMRNALSRPAYAKLCRYCEIATGAEMSSDTSAPIPKCLGANVSWGRSVSSPKYHRAPTMVAL